MKMWRLEALRSHEDFVFNEVDICDKASLDELFKKEFAAVVNLAARAGVALPSTTQLYTTKRI